MKRTQNLFLAAAAWSSALAATTWCPLPANADEKAAPIKEKTAPAAAKPKIALPSVPHAAPFDVEAHDVIQMLWQDDKLRIWLGTAEVEPANLKPTLTDFAQKAGVVAVLAVVLDKKVPRSELEALARTAKEAGVDVFLVWTAPPAGEAAGTVGVKWVFVPGGDNQIPRIPIVIDILPSGAVEIFEKTLAKADAVKLDGLTERLKEMRGFVTELGDPVIVWPARNTTLERYLHVVAVPAAMGFPVDPLTRKVAEEVGGGKNQQNKEGL